MSNHSKPNIMSANKINKKKEGRNTRPSNKKKREARLVVVAELYKKGFTIREIRRETISRLNLKTYSLSTTKKDVDRLVNEWRADRAQDMETGITESIIKHKKIQSEAWEQWELSKRPKTIRTDKKKGAPANGMRSEGIATTEREMTNKEENQVGDPRYLQVIISAQKEIDKLKGLYLPVEEKGVEINYNLNVLTEEQKEVLRSISDDFIRKETATI